MEHTAGLSAKTKQLLTIILVLAIAAIGVTSYLTYLHYAPEASEFCNFSEKFNCEIVNKSIYSRIEIGSLEIPVAVLGLLYYIGVVIGVGGILKKVPFNKIHKWLTAENCIRLIRWLTFLGLLFSLYLTYVEAFILETFCLFCLIQQGLILLILGCLAMIKTKKI